MNPDLATSTPNSVWLLRASDGALLTTPTHYTDLFGRDPEELTENPLAWMKAVSVPDQGRVKRQFLDCALNGTYSTEYVIQLPDGRTRKLRDRTSVIPLSSPAQILRMVEEVEIAESPEDYRILFASNPHPAWIFDKKTFRILAVNQAATETYGYSEEEFLQLTALDLRLPEDIPQFVDLQREPTQPISNFGQWRHRRKDGSLLYVDIISHSVNWRGHNSRLVLALDITDRVLADEEHHRTSERYRRIVEAAHEGIWMVDTEGKILFVNELGAQMLGYGPQELIGMPAQMLLRSTRQDAASRQLGGQQQDVNEQYDTCLVRKDGSEIWAFVSSSAIFHENGSYLGSVSLITDITDRRRLEKKLHESAAELMRSNLDLQQFAYVISHDLQEPLRAISSYLELIARRYGDRLDETGTEFLDFARLGSQRMSMMIRELLAYSRIGRLETDRREECDMNQALQRALANLDALLDEQNAMIVVDDLPTVRANSTLLMQLFQNLVSNAVKYCGDKAPVVRIHAVRRTPEEWQVCVSDNGIGIDAKYSDRIFGVFKRLHGNEYPGSGIGLAICKKIALFHGGQIWVDSTPGEGSRFYFTIPA